MSRRQQISRSNDNAPRRNSRRRRFARDRYGRAVETRSLSLETQLKPFFSLDETRFSYRELNERRLNERPMSDPDTLMQGGAGGSSQISSDLCPNNAINAAAIFAKAVMSLDTSA